MNRIQQGGYDWEQGKSNRALEAEDAGLCTASEAARRLGHGLSAALIKEFVQPDEWHHTSKYFNATNYYNPEEVAVVFGLQPEDDPDYPTFEFKPEAKAALEAGRAKEEETIRTNCTVAWLEWSGTRKHPKATEMKAEGCTVKVKGQTAYVTFPDGKTMTKRLTTNGFSFVGTNS